MLSPSLLSMKYFKFYQSKKKWNRPEKNLPAMVQSGHFKNRPFGSLLLIKWWSVQMHFPSNIWNRIIAFVNIWRLFFPKEIKLQWWKKFYFVFGSLCKKRDHLGCFPRKINNRFFFRLKVQRNFSMSRIRAHRILLFGSERRAAGHRAPNRLWCNRGEGCHPHHHLTR